MVKYSLCVFIIVCSSLKCTQLFAFMFVNYCIICSCKTCCFIQRRFLTLIPWPFISPIVYPELLSGFAQIYLFFFFFPFQSDGSGRSGGTISGGDTVCSPPHLHRVIESAKIVFVILGKGACFKATQGLLKWALVSCMISFRGQERSRTDSSGWEGWLMGFLNFHEKQREVVRPKLCSSCGRKKNPKP